MRARVVAISRTLGAGGEAIGLDVAKELGYHYVDEEIIPIAAEKAGVDPMLVADEEHRKGLIARFFKDLGAGGIATAAAGAYVLADERSSRSDDFRALIRETILEIGDAGDVVIVAHAASFALAGRERVLRVLVTASRDARARRVAEERELGGAEAMKLVERSDAERADYLKRFYSVGHELPTHYDVVVNTDAIAFDTVTNVIVRAATP